MNQVSLFDLLPEDDPMREAFAPKKSTERQAAKRARIFIRQARRQKTRRLNFGIGGI